MVYFTLGPWPLASSFPSMDQPWFLMFTWTSVKNKFSVKGRVGGRHSSELAVSHSSFIQQSCANESAYYLLCRRSQHFLPKWEKVNEFSYSLPAPPIPYGNVTGQAGGGAAELALCTYTNVVVSVDNMSG